LLLLMLLLHMYSTTLHNNNSLHVSHTLSSASATAPHHTTCDIIGTLCIIHKQLHSRTHAQHTGRPRNILVIRCERAPAVKIFPYAAAATATLLHLSMQSRVGGGGAKHGCLPCWCEHTSGTSRLRQQDAAGSLHGELADGTRCRRKQAVQTNKTQRHSCTCHVIAAHDCLSERMLQLCMLVGWWVLSIKEVACRSQVPQPILACSMLTGECNCSVSASAGVSHCLRAGRSRCIMLQAVKGAARHSRAGSLWYCACQQCGELHGHFSIAAKICCLGCSS
jgi:hypothetical protein